MGITNPVMLLFSLSALLILPMYFIKNKYLDYIVPSTKLWEKVINEESKVSKFEKFKNRFIMYLQIIILLLIVLMLAGLYINSKSMISGDNLIFIDNSIMMDYSDGEKSNLDKAKTEAIKIVKSASDDSKFTIVDSRGNALLARDKNYAIDIISDVYQLNTNINTSRINNMISGFRSANEEAYVIIFSNHNAINGDRNYRYASMKDNLAINKIDVYKDNYKILLTNYTRESRMCEIIIKLDNETIEMLSAEVDAGSSKVLSGLLTASGQVMSAKINNEDDIDIDNYASKTIDMDKKIKVFLSNSSSSYIRDALILNDNLLISESVDSQILNDGFDIYIYDGVEADKLPKTGSMLIINPPENSKFVSGLSQKEMYVKLSADDVNSFVEPFYVALSKELNNKSLKTIATLNGKSVIQKGMIGELNTFVMGFDILDTNLPLKYSFPIYIQNIIQYFINDRDTGKIHIVSDQIDLESSYSIKDEIVISREGDSDLLVKLRWIIALLVLAFLALEMEVFKREY